IKWKRYTSAARHNVSCGAAQRSRSARTYLRQAAQKFHPHRRRRQGQRRDVTLRFEQGAHHLPAQLRLSPKSEARNPKEIRIPRLENKTTEEWFRLAGIGISDFSFRLNPLCRMPRPQPFS